MKTPPQQPRVETPQRMSNEHTFMTPHEWHLYLQDIGLISDETVKRNETSLCKTAIKSLQSQVLPPTASIFQSCDFFGTIEVKERVSQGLVWLHEASYRDVRALREALRETESLKSLLDDRRELYGSNATHASQEFTAVCGDLGLTEDRLNIDCDDVAQVAKSWNETQAEKSREELNAVMSHHANFLQTVVTHYQDVCKRTLQSPQITTLLANDEYTVDSYPRVRMELEELLAFYTARHNECSKQCIPSFMTLAATDDIKTQQEHQDGLKKIIEQVKAAQYTAIGQNEVKILESIQERTRKLRQQVDQNNLQARKVERKIQVLQHDIQWCQKRIESVKTTLEEDIAELATNDDAKIQLLDV